MEPILIGALIGAIVGMVGIALHTAAATHKHWRDELEKLRGELKRGARYDTDAALETLEARCMRRTPRTQVLATGEIVMPDTVAQRLRQSLDPSPMATGSLSGSPPPDLGRVECMFHFDDRDQCREAWGRGQLDSARPRGHQRKQLP